MSDIIDSMVNGRMPEHSYQTWTISVPGRFRSDVTYLDLETRKVPADYYGLTTGYVMQNGEVLKNRWSAFMAGVSSMRRITIIERTGSEEWFLMGVREAICSRTIVYSATRQFDEMILKGRFTNARRAHEPDPFYPALPDAEDLDWQNIRNIMGIKDEIIRAEDTPSKGVVHEYDHGDPGLVLIHNLRDVVEMIMVDGKADTECFKWCTRVMRDNEFALKKIMGGEE